MGAVLPPRSASGSSRRSGPAARWRHLGPLTLDMFHRDGQVSGRWLGLHPREFGLIWRLTDRPGERVTRRQLLHDVWRHAHDPETNSVEVHVSRLRGKLARLGCAALVETVPSGGYRIAPGVKLHHGRPFGECGPDESGFANARPAIQAARNSRRFLAPAVPSLAEAAAGGAGPAPFSPACHREKFRARHKWAGASPCQSLPS